MGNCKGLDLCIRKSCLEQEKCIKALIEGVIPKEKHKTRHECRPDCKWMCQILGQCVYDHPLVKADRKAAGQIKTARNRQEIMAVIERLMPSLNRGSWKKPKKQKQ